MDHSKNSLFIPKKRDFSTIYLCIYVCPILRIVPMMLPHILIITSKVVYTHSKFFDVAIHEGYVYFCITKCTWKIDCDTSVDRNHLFQPLWLRKKDFLMRTTSL